MKVKKTDTYNRELDLSLRCANFLLAGRMFVGFGCLLYFDIESIQKWYHSV